MELGDLVSDFIDGLLEFLHTAIHLCKILILKYLENVHLLINARESVKRGAKDFPFAAVVLVIRELIVEKIKYRIDI